MEDREIREWLQAVPPCELTSLLESVFSHDCLKNPVVREAILQYEEQEQVSRVYDYSDEEVFTNYMEFRELLGDPINLTEYLADKREWEYYSQEELEEPGYWEKVEQERTSHALELLAEYEKRNNKID